MASLPQIVLLSSIWLKSQNVRKPVFQRHFHEMDRASPVITTEQQKPEEEARLA